ncbi:uncharacterized protein LOC114184834 isoform X2 [Vigna unguiculata]|uniref:uncharacterized protein LOC114184834 isoform X2 n=1 Tax=Vigna unguiculata TaxID=3917 RepID=UPI001016ADCB|nr:uncharacterized protein LOC114184834 isoform X2 [Vigna unguiculata]
MYTRSKRGVAPNITVCAIVRDVTSNDISYRLLPPSFKISCKASLLPPLQTCVSNLGPAMRDQTSASVCEDCTKSRSNIVILNMILDNQVEPPSSLILYPLSYWTYKDNSSYIPGNPFRVQAYICKLGRGLLKR